MARAADLELDAADGDRYELALKGCETEFVLEVSKRYRVRAGELVLLAIDPTRIRVWPM